MNMNECASCSNAKCGSTETNLNGNGYKYDLNAAVSITADKCCSNSNTISQRCTTGWPYFHNVKYYDPDDMGKFNVPGSFVYLDENKDLKEVYIKQVIYQNPATIVFWSDDTKTVSKTHAGDEYSPEAGLVLCILKKTQGRTLKGLFEAWIPEQAFAQPNKSVIQTLKDVRKFLKSKTK